MKISNEHHPISNTPNNISKIDPEMSILKFIFDKCQIEFKQTSIEPIKQIS